MGRSIGAVVLGLVAGVVVVAAGDAVGVALHPLPEGIDPNDRAALAAAIAKLPAGALLPVFLGWAAAAFVGPFVAAKVAGRRAMMHAMTVGAILLAATVANLIAIPHPTWMWVGALAVFPIGAVLAARATSGSPAAGTSAV
jgi:hypothetical protein